MSACSLSMAAAITAIASSYSSSSSSPVSLPVCNKFSNLSFDHFCLTSIPIYFNSPAKPIKILKPKTQYTNSLSFSLLCLASSSFGSIEATQNTETADPPPNQEQEQDEGEEEGDAVKSLSAEAGRLYVGNLPYAMTSSQVSEVFSEAGHVVSVEIVYDRVTDRSRGFAFVTMGSVEEAQEAIRLFDGAQVGGRTVKVNFPEVPRGGEREVMGPKIRSSSQGFVDSSHKIYAGNLSWGLTSQGLREAFADQSGFLSAKVVYDRDSGRSRGFGFVTFLSAEDVESALNAMNGVELEGRPLRLNMAEQRAPAFPPQTLERNSESDIDSNEMLSTFKH